MDIDLMTMLKFFGIKLLVSRDKQIPVCRTIEDRFGGPLFLYCMALLLFLGRVG